MTKNSILSISGAIVFKDHRGKRLFLVVKQTQDGGWEIPKITVRKGESSVRASIRMTGELAGINARVLEEAGRYTSSALVNGKSVPQRTYYYLLVQRAASEVLGFADFAWLEYSKALRTLVSKREREMVRQGREVLKKLEKEKNW